MGLRICPKCGKKVSDSRCDCIHCGYVFSDKKICPDCETELPADAPECPECGHIFFIIKEKSVEEAPIVTPVKEEAQVETSVTEEVIDEAPTENVEVVAETLETEDIQAEVPTNEETSTKELEKEEPVVEASENEDAADESEEDSKKCPYCGSEEPMQIGNNLFICQICRNKYFTGSSNPSTHVPTYTTYKTEQQSSTSESVAEQKTVSAGKSSAKKPAYIDPEDAKKKPVNGIITILFGLLELVVFIISLAIVSGYDRMTASVFVYIIFGVNLIVMAAMFKKTRHKHAIFLIGFVISLAVLPAQITVHAITANSTKQITPMRILRVDNSVGGLLKVNTTNSYSCSSSYSGGYSENYCMYQVRAGDYVGLTFEVYGGYEYSGLTFKKGNRTIDMSELNVKGSGENWLDFDMPDFDLTISSEFKFRGYELTIHYDYGNTIAWNSELPGEQIIDSSNAMRFRVPEGTNYSFTLTPNESFKYFIKYYYSSSGIKTEEIIYDTYISGYMPNGDVYYQTYSG